MMVLQVSFSVLSFISAGGADRGEPRKNSVATASMAAGQEREVASPARRTGESGRGVLFSVVDFWKVERFSESQARFFLE